MQRPGAAGARRNRAQQPTSPCTNQCALDQRGLLIFAHPVGANSGNRAGETVAWFGEAR